MRMKKILAAMIIVIFGVLSVGITAMLSKGVVHAADYDPNWWKAKSGGRELIGSVDWAARRKGSSTQSRKPNEAPNVCALWIGPSDSSTTTTIVVVNNDGVTADASGEQWYPAAFYGMCTSQNGSNTAQHINFTANENCTGDCDDEIYKGLFKSVSTVSRGYWLDNENLSGTQTFFSIKKFKELATKLNDENGMEVYELTVPVRRCHTGCSIGSQYCCSTDRVTIKLKISSDFLAQSNVSVDGNYKTTGKNAGPGTKTADVSASYSINDTNPSISVPIVFSHNAYATTPTEDADWKVHRVDGDFSLIGGNNDDTVGKADLTEEELEGDKKYYAATGRTASDGTWSYLLRDQYTLNVSLDDIPEGSSKTYKFCEAMGVGKGDKFKDNLTKVCAIITVNRGSTPPPSDNCGGWASAAYNDSGVWHGNSWVQGTTEVLSAIWNKDGSNRGGYPYAGWNTVKGWRSTQEPKYTLYAKPTDKIEWTNCYYPGVQPLAEEMVSTEEDVGNCHPSDAHCNSTTNPKMFKEYHGNWENKFKVVATLTPNGAPQNNIFRDPKDILADESNIISKSAGGGGTNFTLRAEMTIGVNQIKYTDHTYEIKRKNDAGKKYDEKITTESYPTYAYIRLESHSWYNHCCCGYCPTTCSDGSSGCSYCCMPRTCPCNRHTDRFKWGHNYGNRTYENKRREAQTEVAVPYNYENSTDFTLVHDNLDGKNVAYAGETIKVSGAHVIIGTKRNNETSDTYTTQVDNAQAKLVAYVSRSSGGSEQRVKSGDICSHVPYKRRDQCGEEASASGTFNAEGVLTGYTEYGKVANFNGTYNVFDASAGDYMCFVMAVYPSTSGDDKNLDPNGDGEWYISAPKCKVIAKKPSIQIWGGGLYSAGSVSTIDSFKQEIYGKYGYQWGNGNRSGVITNGSWVEEGMTVLGVATYLSSGASLGLTTGNNLGAGIQNDSSYCRYRVPLSIANYSKQDPICGDNNNVDAIGYAGISSIVKNDRKALADYWGIGSTDFGGWSVRLDPNGVGDEIPSATGKNIKIIESAEGDVNIEGGSLPESTVRVVKSANDVRINGDIRYTTNGGLSSAGSIPKVIIYAAGNIYISCNVNQIDAILIAEGEVDTCSEVSHYSTDSPSQDRKLTINGTVIANRLWVKRTYGNAMGSYTDDPAEIINYDSSVLSWGRYMAGSGESDTMTVTYNHELAPRY